MRDSPSVCCSVAPPDGPSVRNLFLGSGPVGGDGFWYHHIPGILFFLFLSLSAGSEAFPAGSKALSPSSEALPAGLEAHPALIRSYLSPRPSQLAPSPTTMAQSLSQPALRPSQVFLKPVLVGMDRFFIYASDPSSCSQTPPTTKGSIRTS